MIPLEAIPAHLSVSQKQLLNASSVFMGIEKLCCIKASNCEGVQVTWATGFCMLVPNICGSSILNFLHVMALRILWQLQDFWKICGLLLLCVCMYPKSLTLLPIQKLCYWRSSHKCLQISLPYFTIYNEKQNVLDCKSCLLNTEPQQCPHNGCKNI